MRQPLSGGTVAAIIGAVVLLLGGAAFMWWRGSDAAPIDKAREQMDAENAKNYYGQYTNQGKANPGTSGGAPPTGGTSTEAEARARMQGGGQ